MSNFEFISNEAFRASLESDYSELEKCIEQETGQQETGARNGKKRVGKKRVSLNRGINRAEPAQLVSGANGRSEIALSYEPAFPARLLIAVAPGESPRRDGPRGDPRIAGNLGH